MYSPYVCHASHKTQGGTVLVLLSASEQWLERVVRQTPGP